MLVGALDDESGQLRAILSQLLQLGRVPPDPRPIECCAVAKLPGACGYQLVVGQDVKGQMKTPIELVLPLFGQTARADHEAAMQIAAHDQLLDEEPRHNRFPGARIIGQ